MAAKQRAESESQKLLQEAEARRVADFQAAQEFKRIDDEKQAAAKEASKAPDKVKLILWITKLEAPMPDMKSEAAKATAADIAAKFEGFKRWANTQIEKL